jgi:hypothetical protein
MLRRLLLLGCVCFVATSVSAAEPSPCGITRVEKTPFGVNVYFGKTTSLDVRRDGAVWKVVVDPEAPAPPSPVNGVGRYRALAVLPGDRFFWSAGMHAGCNMAVILMNDSIGIETNEGVAAPGLPPWQARRFVPAE